MSEFNFNLGKTDRKILFQTEEFEIVSIKWTDQVISPLHNHGWSQCLVLVEEGVFENRLNLGAKQEIQLLEKGQVLSTPVGAQHEMRCQTATGRTLHVYTPKIEVKDDSGVFHALVPNELRNEIRLSDPTQTSRLKELLVRIQESSITTSSPYFMNQLFSGVMPQMLMAEELISKTKTTLATFEASPVLSTIEGEVVEALGAKIGWSAGSRSGVSVPGGSAANFMALHCARQKAFPDAKEKGVLGVRFKVFISSEAHYSFKKACAVLGLGTASLVPVPVDDRGRMKPESLETLIKQHLAEGAFPLLVAATAGTTVLGAFDEITPLSSICKQYGLWLHVDGAWGGPAIFSKKLRHLLRGVELADSVTFDAHKLFGASLTSSFFLTKHSGILLEANDVSGGDYLFHSDDPSLDRGKLSWQCGRKADAVSFWAIWKSLGTDGLGEFVDRLVTIQKQTVDWIKDQPRLSLVQTPDYLNICVRVASPNGSHVADWSKRVRENLKQENLAMVNYSTNEEGTYLRLILAHPFLRFEHVQQILTWALAVR